MGGTRGLKAPAEWSDVAPQLYKSPRTRRAAERLGAAFGDPALFARMHTILADNLSGDDAKLHALRILGNDDSASNLPLLLGLLENEKLAVPVILALKRYNDPTVATALVARLAKRDGSANNATLEVLSSRTGWSHKLLDAIVAGDIDKNRLTAFYARQMANLRDSALNKRLTKQWGRLSQSSAERMAEVRKLAIAYKSAPLWAYDRNAGQAHFKKLCSACHQPPDPNMRLAPKLEGTGTKGIDYIVENIVDPNAVIGKDFQARIIVTVKGRVVSGLIVKETDSAVTVATGTSTETVGKDDIDEISISQNSFMPEGLLKPLNDREKIELLRYLMTARFDQVHSD